MKTRREQILEAALPLFAARGFAGATTRALAGAAGVNVATLAYHFGDKKGLYDAVVDRIYGKLLALALPTMTHPPGDAEQTVRVLVDTLYRHALRNREGIRLLLRHVMEQGGSPQRVRGRWSIIAMAKAADILAELDLDPAVDLRLTLLSLNHLIARYAVTDPAHLAPFVNAADPRQAVADHLGTVACALLMIS